MNAIINVSGEKGGAGKSIVSMAVIHYYVGRGNKVLLIESDDSNCDVGLAYNNEANVICQSCKLDNTDGWMDLIDHIEANPDSVVVINSPARIGTGVKEYGDLLTAALPELKRELVTLWVMDDKKNVVGMLRDYIELMPQSKMLAVRNLYHGPEESFETYNSSNTRQQLESNGGKTINFPIVARRITQLLQGGKRYSIQKAAFDAATPISMRVEAQKWVHRFSDLFDGLLPGGAA